MKRNARLSAYVAYIHTQEMYDTASISHTCPYPQMAHSHPLLSFRCDVVAIHVHMYVYVRVYAACPAMCLPSTAACERRYTGLRCFSGASPPVSQLPRHPLGERAAARRPPPRFVCLAPNQMGRHACWKRHARYKRNEDPTPPRGHRNETFYMTPQQASPKPRTFVPAPA